MATTNAERQKEWRKRHSDKVKKYWLDYYYRNHERLKSEGRTRAKAKRIAERDAIIRAYGGKCVCCGESTPEFLCLDHKHNDGNIEREKYGIAGAYKRAIKQGFPDKYQLLFQNCNAAKWIYGICPHQRTN